MIERGFFRMMGWLSRQPAKVPIGLMLVPGIGAAVIVLLVTQSIKWFLLIFGLGMFAAVNAAFMTFAHLLGKKTQLMGRYAAEDVTLRGLSWGDFERFMHYLLELERYQVERRVEMKPMGALI